MDNKNKGKKSVLCKICGIRLPSFTALGGHTSKAHPKMSVEFQKRMKVRKARTLDRQILKAAKEIFHKLYPGLDVNPNRNRINLYKDQMRKELDNLNVISTENNEEVFE